MSAFSIAIMHAPDLTETDKIHWFHKGLIPEIRSKTLCDIHGDQWVTLSALYKYAKGLERNMVASGTRYIGARPDSYGQGKRSSGGNAGKGAGMFKPRLAGIQKKHTKSSHSPVFGQVFAAGQGGRVHTQIDKKKDSAFKKLVVHQQGHLREVCWEVGERSQLWQARELPQQAL